MIYLNNAGTSWPKPSTVTKAIEAYNHSLPDKWPGFLEVGLKDVRAFFSIPDEDELLITTSCTAALNTALMDFNWIAGDRIAISGMEHHAVSRLFFKLQMERSVKGIIIPRADDSPFDLSAFEQELKKGLRLVAVSMVSNVTGELLPYQKIIDLCKTYGAYCLLDGAQAVGVINVNIKEIKPDFFAFGGHKGLLSSQGIGGLYIKKSVPMACPSASCQLSENGSQSSLPNYCDVGSVNMAGVASLSAGLNWILERGIDNILSHKRALLKMILPVIDSIDHLEIVGGSLPEDRLGVIAIKSNNYVSNELSKKLYEADKILVSSGFQCAPITHNTLNTAQEGLVRLSIGPFNTKEEMVRVKLALEQT